MGHVVDDVFVGVLRIGMIHRDGEPTAKLPVLPVQVRGVLLDVILIDVADVVHGNHHGGSIQNRVHGLRLDEEAVIRNTKVVDQVACNLLPGEHLTTLAQGHGTLRRRCHP